MTIEDENEIIGFWKDNASRCFDYWGLKYNYEPDIYYNGCEWSKSTIDIKNMISYIKRKPC